MQGVPRTDLGLSAERTEVTLHAMGRRGAGSLGIDRGRQVWPLLMRRPGRPRDACIADLQGLLKQALEQIRMLSNRVAQLEDSGVGGGGTAPGSRSVASAHVATTPLPT